MAAEGESEEFEPSSTSQFLSREVPGVVVVLMPGAIKGRRSTLSPLAQAQQHSLLQTAGIADKSQ